MLTDDQIDKLIQPIVDTQETLNLYVLKEFVKFVLEIEKATTTNVLALQQKLDIENRVKKIYKKLEDTSTSQLDEISKLLFTVAVDSYVDSEYLYKYRKINYPGFIKNKSLYKEFQRVTRDCIELCIAVLIADKLVLSETQTTIKNAFQDVLNRCTVAKMNKTITYTQQIKSLLNQLCESGVRTARGQSVTASLRKAIVESVKNTQQTVQDVVAKQVKADGVELSAHIDSAPDHEPVQGRQFTLEEFEKLQNEQVSTSVTGKQFEPIRRAIGEWNCRHFTYAIIVGVSKPRYTESALEQLQRENSNWFVTDDGRHMSMYECTQYQRYLERMIRLNKTKQTIFKQAHDMKTATLHQSKINKLIEEYADFSELCHISAKWERTNINDYEPLKANEYVYY